MSATKIYTRVRAYGDKVLPSKEQVIQRVKKASWWEIAALTVGVSALGALSSMLSKKEERKVYNKTLKQAPWAPPAWVFGPAWTMNNFFLIKALRDIVTEEDLPKRRQLLFLQAGIWAIFFSFNFIYFRKRSTVLAAAWTQTDAVLALASFLVANRQDKKLARNFLPLVGWTWFASTVAHYQALKNPDKLLGTKALLK